MHILSNIPMFDGLSDEDLSAIVKLAREKHFDSGEVIFEQNTTGNQFYIVLEGEVDIRVINPLNRSEPIVLATLQSDEVFGEFSLFDDSPRSASAVTKTSAVLLEIDNTALLELFDKNSWMGMVIYKNLGSILCSRLRHMDIGFRNSVMWIGLQNE